MGERLLTALGAVAAAVAVIAAFALLLSALDGGGGDEAARTTVIRVVDAGGNGRAGDAVDGGKVPVPGSASVPGPAPVPGPATGPGSASGPGPATGPGSASRPAPASGPASNAGSAPVTGPSPRPGSASGGPAPAPAMPPPALLGRPRAGTAFEIARVRKGARIGLRSAPGGPVVARLGDRTEFGSPTSLSVVVTKPGWLGVTAAQVPDGELAWVARDPRKVDVYWTRWSIHADLAGRGLELRYGKRTVRRFAVTIGGPGTETPPGRYGVTDGLSFRASPYYGCCALALSGHQTTELPGWIGGDRLAIHGTPGAVGNAESLGCIRATDETMRYLFRRIPLGTPVFIDA